MSEFRRRLMMARYAKREYITNGLASEQRGTIDNPIPYSVNMELVQGLYYIEDGIVYLCTVSLAASYWALKDLVGTYVELVN